jgi:phosphoribosylanthranilate isomerase
MTFVKVCGMTRREDVEAAVELGVDALGFILVPASPRFLPTEEAAELARTVPEGVRRVAVMMNPSCVEVEAVAQTGAFDCIQFHGAETPEMVRGCRLETIKAFAVAEEGDLERSADYAAASFFLFDSKKRSFGTGVAFDHSLLCGRTFAKPFLLAGGLRHDTLRGALEQVRPFGIDLNSGVEDAPGVKNRVKLAVAVATVRDFDTSERREHR